MAHRTYHRKRSKGLLGPLKSLFTSKKSKYDPHSHKHFSRRAFLVAGAQVLLGGALMGRLAYLSNSKESTYKALAEENRVKVNFLLPERGGIVDRNGVSLAENTQSYRLMVSPDQCVSLKQTLKDLSVLYPLEQEDADAILERVKYRPKFIPTCVGDGLSWEDVCRLEMHLRDFPGCFIEQGWSRVYPHPYETAHLLGYVQAPSKEDQQKNSFYRLADFRIGKSGIEKQYDETLRGTIGFHRIEVNSKGRTVRQLEHQESIMGPKQTLSLDLRVQKMVQERLKSIKSGSAVVMDIETGEVIALVSAPSFDANLFTNGIHSKDWKQLLHNPYKCLHNKAIQGLYPPGSLFKMVVALAAFESGLVSPTYQCDCKGFVTIGNHRFHCWHKFGGHGKTDIVKALYQSCDVYFYELAQKIGAEPIRKMAERFGFGFPTDIELPGEKKGLIPTDTWMRKMRRRGWMKGDSLNLSIGQGAMLATPLQLTAMMASLGNAMGHFVKPTLHKQNQSEVRTEKSKQGQLIPSGLNPKFLKLIQKGLMMTVNSPKGLAYKNRIEEHGFEMAGKTATCQVRRISMAERKKGILHNDQRPFHHRDHALFTGYAPLKKPKYAVTVVVEHGGAGGRVATPIGRDILLETQKIMQDKPDVIKEDLSS